MKKRTKAAVLSALFAVSLTLVLYPFFANIHNNRLEKELIVEYEDSVSEIDEADYAGMIAAAQAWNEELYTLIEPSYFPDGLTDSEIYESLLSIGDDGMMGYVVIPKINVSLAIYHYTDDEVLLKGAGHMEASALPVGGESTHCIITAHRGLPTAAMFTDLDRLEIGDVFYLKVLGETFAYEVIQIQEVDPDETASLLPQYGKDLCTLVTCTPYGINTQRLLVTGERTEYDEEEYARSVSDTSAVEEAFDADYILVYSAAAESTAYALLLIYLVKMPPGGFKAQEKGAQKSRRKALRGKIPGHRKKLRHSRAFKRRSGR